MLTLSLGSPSGIRRTTYIVLLASTSPQLPNKVGRCEHLGASIWRVQS
jgi:hypothetical protein